MSCITKRVCLSCVTKRVCFYLLKSTDRETDIFLSYFYWNFTVHVLQSVCVSLHNTSVIYEYTSTEIPHSNLMSIIFKTVTKHACVLKIILYTFCLCRLPLKCFSTKCASLFTVMLLWLTPINHACVHEYVYASDSEYCFIKTWPSPV